MSEIEGMDEPSWHYTEGAAGSIIKTIVKVIRLATHKNAVGVTVGAKIGHTICTSLAVVGRTMLASKISQRTVAMVGGLLFLYCKGVMFFYFPCVKQRD